MDFRKYLDNQIKKNESNDKEKLIQITEKVEKKYQNV